MSLSRFAGLGLVAAAVCTIGLVYAATTASGANAGAVERVADEAAPDYSSWAVDPTTAGPNLPPVGRSLFDFLVTQTEGSAGTFHVPFPFSALIDRIRARSGNREYGGGIRVAIENPDGSAIVGFGLDDCPVIFGNSIERVVPWKAGAELKEIAGKPVRLRFELRDADLYSFQFVE